MQQTMGGTQSIMWQGGMFYGTADSRRPNALAAGIDELPKR